MYKWVKTEQQSLGLAVWIDRLVHVKEMELCGNNDGVIILLHEIIAFI